MHHKNEDYCNMLYPGRLTPEKNQLICIFTYNISLYIVYCIWVILVILCRLYFSNQQEKLQVVSTGKLFLNLGKNTTKMVLSF